MEAEPRFKVIIVGSGVAGLTLGHCLVKAEIDFVLLEKGVVGPSFGTTITMQPHGCRILHQLGCLDAVLAQCSTMGGAHCRTSCGRSFAYNDFFGVVRKYAGYDTRTLDRQNFLKTLYDHLPEASKKNVFEHARVEHVIEENSTVKVLVADGREFVGDLVVGADGVHSKLRELMWDAANSAVPGYISVREKRAMKTTYNAIVASCRPVPGLGSHDMEITSHNGFSFLLLCQPDWISFIVHCKLPPADQCHWPTRRRYSTAHMDDLAARLASCPVTDSVCFAELWKRRIKAQMISLEEGVLDHWFWGRTVLMGDAVHKVTPNSALGGNTAMEDAATLTNGLRACLALHPNKKPSDREVGDALRGYEAGRLGRARAIVAAGADLTRLQAYDGWRSYFVQRWVTPVVGLDVLARNIAELCVGAPRLDFDEGVGRFGEERGLLGWKDSMAEESRRKKKEEGKVGISTRGDGDGESGGVVKMWKKAGYGWWEGWSGDFESVVPGLLLLWAAMGMVMGLFLVGRARFGVPGFEVVVDVGGNATSL